MDADASMMSVLPRSVALARDSAAHSTSRGCGSTNTVGCPKFGLNRLSRGEAFFGRVVERIEHIEQFHSVGSLVLIEAKPWTVALAGAMRFESGIPSHLAVSS